VCSVIIWNTKTTLQVGVYTDTFLFGIGFPTATAVFPFGVSIWWTSPTHGVPIASGYMIRTTMLRFIETLPTATTPGKISQVVVTGVRPVERVVIFVTFTPRIIPIPLAIPWAAIVGTRRIITAWYLTLLRGTAPRFRSPKLVTGVGAW